MTQLFEIAAMRTVRLLVLTAGFALPLTACSSEPSFAVGDCVRIEPRLADFKLVEASCEDAVGTLDPNEQIYEVKQVLEGTEGGCPALQGFFPVEFTDEPEDVTYCLVMAT